MLLAPRPLFSNFDGVMATDLALQDERQADGTSFRSIVTLFHPPFLEARGRLFHTTWYNLPLPFSPNRLVWIIGKVS